jgi:flagellin
VGLYINTNLAAIDAAGTLKRTDRSLQKSMQRLSSGLRINTAADDAAGCSISQVLTAQIRGVDQASRNAQDGISLVQTAEGALHGTQQMLHRIRELAVQYLNGTLASPERTSIQSEVDQLVTQIEKVGTTAQFNGILLLNGAAPLSFQIGANDNDVVSLATVSLGQLLSPMLAGGASFTLAMAMPISAIDAAIDNTSAAEATFGTVQNRLEYTINNLGNYEENLSSANSRIKDVDMAFAASTFTAQQILEQSGVAMLSQAERAPQTVLSLLSG